MEALDQPGPDPQPEQPHAVLAPPLTTSIRVVHDLRVPMRDGVELALDLQWPDLPGPLPVVLTRTPYDKVTNRSSNLSRTLAEQGYIVASADIRGRFNSDGEFRPYFNEADDGYDTVEWIVAQEWCDGNVGMIGGSYAAQTGWFAASKRPPHLKAVVAFSSPPSTLWRNEPFFGGCFMLGIAEWAVKMGYRSWQDLDFMNLFSEQQECFETLPVAAIPESAGVRSRWWDEWMQHPTYDEFWKQGSYDNHDDMQVAALNVTGWWDLNFPGAPLNFEGMRKTAFADRQKLVIGPWTHWVNYKREVSGVDFGPNAIVELINYTVRFLDRWLKDAPNGIDEEKPVHVFVLGANEWWAEDDWPLPGTEHVAYYLHSAGAANGWRGDGTLSPTPPEVEPTDAYVYAPATANRTLWKLLDGPVDDAADTDRDDVLCYTSEPLTEPLDVVGWVTCQLYASSSALDTDWHVRLVDVHPDGSARFLCRGALRARFRESFETPKLLEPGVPTSFEIAMDACGVRFLPGHRIRVEIASSWFTRYDRNTNSGAENFFTDDEIVTANQVVYHEAGLESRVVLPVVRGR